jgi:hypothetical protein
LPEKVKEIETVLTGGAFSETREKVKTVENLTIGWTFSKSLFKK